MTSDIHIRYFGPYTLCGWKVYSEIYLPELSLWDSSAPERDSLVIESGDISLHAGISGLTTTSRNDIIFRIPDICGFLISATGDHVIIQRETGADPIAVRGYLYGSVLAILCYLHGLFPLHGSGISIGEAAIAFTGHSGTGKSTLAMAMALRGYPVLSDDVCAIELREHALPFLHPSILRVKLLQDAIDNFHLGPATTYSQAEQGAKGHFGIAEATPIKAISKPVPLTSVYLLDADDEASVQIEPLRGKQNFTYWAQQAHRAWIGRHLGLQRRLFDQCAHLAQTVPLCRLKRPRVLGRLNETIDLLEIRHSACGRHTYLAAACDEPKEEEHSDRQRKSCGATR